MDYIEVFREKFDGKFFRRYPVEMYGTIEGFDGDRTHLEALGVEILKETFLSDARVEWEVKLGSQAMTRLDLFLGATCGRSAKGNLLEYKLALSLSEQDLVDLQYLISSLRDSAVLCLWGAANTKNEDVKAIERDNAERYIKHSNLVLRILRATGAKGCGPLYAIKNDKIVPSE